MVPTADSEPDARLQIDELQDAPHSPLRPEQFAMHTADWWEQRTPEWYEQQPREWWEAQRPEGYYAAQPVKPSEIPEHMTRPVGSPDEISDVEERLFRALQADRQGQPLPISNPDPMAWKWSMPFTGPPPRELVQGPLTYIENHDAFHRHEIARIRAGLPSTGSMNWDVPAPLNQALVDWNRWTDDLERGEGCWVPMNDVPQQQ